MLAYEKSLTGSQLIAYRDRDTVTELESQRGDLPNPTLKFLTPVRKSTWLRCFGC